MTRLLFNNGVTPSLAAVVFEAIVLLLLSALVSLGFAMFSKLRRVLETFCGRSEVLLTWEREFWLPIIVTSSPGAIQYFTELKHLFEMTQSC